MCATDNSKGDTRVSHRHGTATFAILLSALTGLASPCVAAKSSPPPAAAGARPAPIVPDTATVARISAPQAVAAAARGEIVLVDVRPLPQRAIGHVRDDVWVPINRIGTGADLPSGKKLVFYCSCAAEELAIEAARAVMAAGRTQVAAMVGGFDAWRAAGGAIAVDATWEQSFRVEMPPVGWGKTPVDSSRCSYGRDDLNAFSGQASGRIGCFPDTAARGLAGFVQRLDAGPCLGRSVTLTAAVRGDHVLGVAYLWVGAEDAKGKLIAMHRAEQFPIRGSQEWHFAQVGEDVPPDAARVLIGLSLAGAGQVWLDEVKLKVEAAGDLPARPLIVKNPGFEE
jgi:rhodanese-related sulfurtransferase